MTGRERVEAAFSRDGAAQLPVVICYENVFIRDHWPQLTSCPWWYLQAPDGDGQDWIHLFAFCTADERVDLPIEERAEGVYRCDPDTGNAEQLSPPQVSG